MADSTGIDLGLLATTHAGDFIYAFLEALDGGFTREAIYEIEELTHSDVVDGISIQIAHSEGGGEGQGDYVERVWEVRHGSTTLSFIRVTGYYESYAGTEYNDDWSLVVPREVVHIKYFSVDGTDNRS